MDLDCQIVNVHNCKNKLDKFFSVCLQRVSIGMHVEAALLVVSNVVLLKLNYTENLYA